jgi:hypothetical protein
MSPLSQVWLRTAASSLRLWMGTAVMLLWFRLESPIRNSRNGTPTSTTVCFHVSIYISALFSLSNYRFLEFSNIWLDYYVRIHVSGVTTISTATKPTDDGKPPT